MVKFELVPGRKGPSDQLVKVYSYGEVLSFSDLLFILDKYFRSEESYYPKPQFEGSAMLMKAIVEVYSDIPLETVRRKYKLDRKVNRTTVVEKLRATPSESPPSPLPPPKAITKLSEVLGEPKKDDRLVRGAVAVLNGEPRAPRRF